MHLYTQWNSTLPKDLCKFPVDSCTDAQSESVAERFLDESKGQGNGRLETFGWSLEL